MLNAGIFYPATCNPADVKTAQDENRKHYMFTDVQVRGHYPCYMLTEYERQGFAIPWAEGDEEVLAQNPVDFVGFSYYSTRVAQANTRGSSTPIYSRVPPTLTSRWSHGADSSIPQGCASP